jgi:hypothetical protein
MGAVLERFLITLNLRSLSRNFFFPVLGLELRAYTLSHSTIPFFVMGVFEIGSPKLFSRAGFKPRSF